jgi:hypothetical protein
VTDDADSRGAGGGGGASFNHEDGDDDGGGDGREYDEYDYDDDGASDDDETDADAVAEPVGMFAPQVKRLRKSVLIELAIAVVVLVATSVLVQSSPVQNASGVSVNSQGTVSLTSPLYTLQVEFLPSGSGTDIHMFFYNPAGGPQPVKSVAIVATSPQQGGLTEDLGSAPISDSHWTSTAVLPVSGKWTFTFTVRTTAIDEAPVSTVQNIG